MDIERLTFERAIPLVMHDILLRMQDGLDIPSPLLGIHPAEQEIQLLQRLPLGLAHDQEGPGAHAQTEEAEHEEGAPADVGHGDRRDLGDGEVAQPLRRGGEADAVGSQARREDLRDVDPGDGAPGRGIPDHEEVDHDDHGDGGGGDGRRFGVGGVGDEHGREDEHHRHHPGGAEDEGLATAQGIDAGEQEDARGDDLDGAVDARGEQGRVGRRDADRLEDLRRVVADRVGAGELLPEHEAEGREEAEAVGGRETLLPGEAFGGRELLLDRGPDLGDFPHDFLVVDGRAARERHRGAGLLVPPLFRQPPRRFLQEEQTDEEEAARDELDGDGDPPLLGRCGYVQRDAVVQPVRKGRAEDEKLLEHARHAAADGRRRILRHEDRRDARHAADAQPRNHAAGVDLPDAVTGARLHRGPHQEDGREAQQRVSPPEAIAAEGRGDGAEEAARRQQRHHVRGHLCIFRAAEPRRLERQAEVAAETWEREHRAHDAGIVACVHNRVSHPAASLDWVLAWGLPRSLGMWVGWACGMDPEG